MKSILVFLICLVMALWLVAIAILSVQNATLVSLSFLNLQSIQIPIGVVLGVSVAMGTIGGSVAMMGPSVFKSNSRRKTRDSRSNR